MVGNHKLLGRPGRLGRRRLGRLRLGRLLLRRIDDGEELLLHAVAVIRAVLEHGDELRVALLEALLLSDRAQVHADLVQLLAVAGVAGEGEDLCDLVVAQHKGAHGLNLRQEVLELLHLRGVRDGRRGGKGAAAAAARRHEAAAARHEAAAAAGCHEAAAAAGRHEAAAAAGRHEAGRGRRQRRRGQRHGRGHALHLDKAQLNGLRHLLLRGHELDLRPEGELDAPLLRLGVRLLLLVQEDRDLHVCHGVQEEGECYSNTEANYLKNFQFFLGRLAKPMLLKNW